MIKKFETEMTKSDIVPSPKDDILIGVILNITEGLLSEFLDPKVHDKFDNLEQPTLMIDYECLYKDNHIKGSDKLAYYEKPQSNSKLAKFLTKYGTLKVGTEIKVIYDDDGFGKIKVD